MDTPWLYLYTSHKLSRLQLHTLQLTSELTASKWLSLRTLVLQGSYRSRSREKEARLEIYSPACSYLQVRIRLSVWPVQSEYHRLYVLVYRFVQEIHTVKESSHTVYQGRKKKINVSDEKRHTVISSKLSTCSL